MVPTPQTMLFLSPTTSMLRLIMCATSATNMWSEQSSDMMLGQSEQEKLSIAVAAGKIGGSARSRKMLEERQMFYDPLWQREHGFKDGGKRNIRSGHLERLNEEITKNRPEQRSSTGRLGAAAHHLVMKSSQKGLWSKDNHIQKLANLKRWGIKINGKRIPFESLSSDFIDYHILYGNQKEY